MNPQRRPNLDEEMNSKKEEEMNFSEGLKNDEEMNSVCRKEFISSPQKQFISLSKLGSIWGFISSPIWGPNWSSFPHPFWVHFGVHFLSDLDLQLGFISSFSLCSIWGFISSSIWTPNSSSFPYPFGVPFGSSFPYTFGLTKNIISSENVNLHKRLYDKLKK